MNDEHTDSLTANTDSVRVARGYTVLTLRRPSDWSFLPVMTSSTLVSNIRRRSPMLPIGRLPESLSNHRRSQLNHRRLWLTNFPSNPFASVVHTNIV
jgi:hypothetical protein